jgi:hypothetical protein
VIIPKRKIGGWINEIVETCMPDIEERIQRGALYRNLFLTGDENGNPATYNKTFEYMDNLASFLFSPEQLHYFCRIGSNATDRAKGRVVAGEIGTRLMDAGVYTCAEDCTLWSLIKGKALLKLLWEHDNFAPYLVQPEFFGVLRADVADLSRQEAFVHTYYYTPIEFASAFRNLPNLAQVMRGITRQGLAGRPDEHPERANALKQIVLGGLNPFQQAGGSPATASSRGIVNWLGGPQPTFDPNVLAQLIRVNEVWVKDSITDDWATFQATGETVITGEGIIRNAFADMFDPDNKLRRLPDEFRKHNPMAYQHPFIEFQPNRLEGYFWGRSEVCNVGVLQMRLNARMDGIARLLRRQENPPRLFQGMPGINQQKLSALDKPGGFYSDPGPAQTAKMSDVYPKIPEGMWEEIHELLGFYDSIAGLPPVLQGRGEAGVRAQGHAETLTRNATPRFKDRALSIERSVSDIGQLALNMLRAMEDQTLYAWVKPDTLDVVAKETPDAPEMEPPAPGMKAVPFTFAHVPSLAKVRVDSHSSSPVFIYEHQQLIFQLARLGVLSPEDIVEHIHPAGEEDVLDEIQEREIKRAAQVAKLPPEDQAKVIAGPGRRR